MKRALKWSGCALAGLLVVAAALLARPTARSFASSSAHEPFS